MKEFYKFICASCAPLILSFIFPAALSAQRTLTARSATVVDTYIHGFYESLPASYAANPSKKYPLLIFLHGTGERGDGSASALPLVLHNGPPMQIYQQIVNKTNANFPDPVVVAGKSFEFIVIAPQLNTWPSNGKEQTAVDDMINYAIAHYHVDTTKMYLTGLSMGGGISWEYPGFSRVFAKRLAGLLVIAGASSPSKYRAAEIVAAHLPVWATANAVDPTVPPSYTTDYVNLLNTAGANPAPLETIFGDSGHGGWLKTYGGPNQAGVVQNGLNVYQWMLQYKRVGDNVALETATTSVFTVNAGADITITLPTNSTRLTGTATVQNETVSTTAWKQVSGPSTATITNGGTITPTVSALVAGSYVFEVDMTSTSGKTATDQVKVTVNPAPVVSVFSVSAGSDITITLPTNSATLTGTATVQNETVSTTAWKQVSGPSTATITNGGTITPTVGALVAGSYVFEVDMTSASGKTTTDQVKVTVNPAPVVSVFTVSAGPDITITLPTNSVKITGSTTVTGETVSTCKWIQVSGPSTATISGSGSIAPTVSALIAGSYVFEVDLTAVSGKTASDQVTVSVSAAPANTVFTVSAGPDVSINLPANIWKIAGVCTVKGQTVASCKWTQVSGPSTATIAGGGSVTPTVSALVLGSYVFQVDVASTTGSTSSDQMKLTVNAASASFPNPVTVGTDSIILQQSLKLYPNPSHGLVYLSLTDPATGKLEVSLTAVDGHVLHKWSFEKQTTQWTQSVDPGNLPAGTYFITIRGTDIKEVKSFIRN